jgi:hypothetical protein
VLAPATARRKRRPYIGNPAKEPCFFQSWANPRFAAETELFRLRFAKSVRRPNFRTGVSDPGYCVAMKQSEKKAAHF